MCLRAFVGDRVASHEWVAAAAAGRSNELPLRPQANLSSRYVFLLSLSFSIPISVANLFLILCIPLHVSIVCTGDAIRSGEKEGVSSGSPHLALYSRPNFDLPPLQQPVILSGACVSRSGGRQAHETCARARLRRHAGARVCAELSKRDATGRQHLAAEAATKASMAPDSGDEKTVPEAERAPRTKCRVGRTILTSRAHLLSL
ncbi:hypothetical protein MRX96_001869 [Rhipicephalus microplus]